MHIDAIYDFLCPWCLIAKRQLAIALEQEGDAGLTITCHQFMLYPDFAFEKITRGAASIDGHRLVRWAEKPRLGSAGDLIKTIARGFYEQAEVIDLAFLVRTATEHGFDPAKAFAHLESEADLVEPFAETAEWRRRGVNSMPHFRLHFADGNTEILTTTLFEAFADALRRDRQLAPLAATGS